ncbi:hypothetical protein AUC70_04530 [Methyloceanibacter stevinii]|uniref:DUF5681 domain-containing protein n=1 Tax=Methyloceanibacter stevinii TaxID=1774970 RepID=A0A1E3VNZ8_9HYPH|nr:hypothetical protein AUC70_04530 [Methyloceanibacter stevinii]
MPKTSESTSTSSIFLKQVERIVTVREGETIREAPAIEAVIQSQVASACKGNALAQKDIINRHERATDEKRQRLQAEVERCEHYISGARSEMAAAERLGQQAPRLFPHPDDIYIDRETGVRFVGPFDEESLTQVEETCRVRDILLMQDALDQRSWNDLDSDDPLDGPGTALLFAQILNDGLPDRFKLDDPSFVGRMMRLECIPKRQLLKDVYRGWQSIGLSTRRGRLFPPLRYGKTLVALLLELVRRVRNGYLDGSAAPEDIEADLADLILEGLHGAP